MTLGTSGNKPYRPPAFEQAMLERAFVYSIEDQVENTDKVIRALKGVLVQKKVRDKFNESKEGAASQAEMMERLEELEERPVTGIRTDIYGICNLLRVGTDRVVVWQNGQPCNIIHKKQLKNQLRAIMDELNIMSGSLCEALEIPLFSLRQHGQRKISYPTGRREQNEA